MSLGPIRKTTRGFEIIEFRDDYGGACSLQQSSWAKYEQPGTSAVWLGKERERMHLHVGAVKALRDHLDAWLETGSFHAASEEGEAPS